MVEQINTKFISYWPIIIFITVLIAGSIVVKETVNNNTLCLLEIKEDLSANVKPKVTLNRESIIRLEQNYNSINNRIENIESFQKQTLQLQQDILTEIRE